MPNTSSHIKPKATDGIARDDGQRDDGAAGHTMHDADEKRTATETNQVMSVFVMLITVNVNVAVAATDRGHACGW